MIRIRNLNESLDFFCNTLGLKEVSRKEYEQGRFTLVFLAAPEDLKSAQEERAPTIELTYNWDNEEIYPEGRNFGHLAFRVKNIYDVCAELSAKGVTINRPPRDGYMAFVRSPDNISIELLQEGAPLPPSEPWLSMSNSGHW